MKTKNFIILASLLLLNSCIVKSLNPFYTKDKVVTESRLEGEWQSKKANWKIRTFENLWNELEKQQDKVSNEDKKTFAYLKNSYAVEITKNPKKGDSFVEASLEKSGFVATAFNVDGHIFLDFYPLQYETDGMSNFVSQHILNTHSVCLVEFNDEDNLKLKWLDEDVVSELIENNNLKIKHEKTGLENEEVVLTASSEELYRFLQKFMSSTIENKWEADQIVSLSR